MKQCPPSEVPKEALEKSREIIFNLLEQGFKNLEPKYYILEGDRRNPEAET